MSLSAIVVRRLRARSSNARTKALLRMPNISDPGARTCVIAPGVAS
jgi:hypothetical protein